MPHLERHGDVWLLNLGDGQNRFNPGWVSSVNGALDEVEHAAGPLAANAGQALGLIKAQMYGGVVAALTGP
jgi:hypothetical protein